MTFLKSVSVKSEPEIIISEVYYRTLPYKSLKLTWYLCSFSRNPKIPFANNSVEIFHCLYPEFTSFSSPIYLHRKMDSFCHLLQGLYFSAWMRWKNIRNFYTSGVWNVISQFLAALLSQYSRNEILVSVL